MAGERQTDLQPCGPECPRAKQRDCGLCFEYEAAMGERQTEPHQAERPRVSDITPAWMNYADRLEAEVARLRTERDKFQRRWNEAEDFARDRQWDEGSIRQRVKAEIVAKLRAPQSPDADVLFPQHSLNAAAYFIEREFPAPTRTQEAAKHCTSCGHTSDLHSPGGDYLCRGRYVDGGECRCQFFTTAPRTADTNPGGQ